MLLVLDTNIWLSELALNSHRGAAVRFFIRQRKGVVCIPEVVRLELERNLTRSLTELTEKVRKNYEKLLGYFGKLKEVVLPTSDEIAAKVSEILTSLDVPTRDLPFSMEAARSSFLKTVDKTPPSNKSQEFKDGVIWAHCLDLLADDDVYLITEDKAFYNGRDYKQGLARELLKEASSSSHQIVIVPSLEDLLQDIQCDVQIWLRESERGPGRRQSGHENGDHRKRILSFRFGIDFPERRGGSGVCIRWNITN